MASPGHPFSIFNFSSHSRTPFIEAAAPSAPAARLHGEEQPGARVPGVAVAERSHFQFSIFNFQFLSKTRTPAAPRPCYHPSLMSSHLHTRENESAAVASCLWLR